eukprot:TRINITY_DN4471_c0_g1_i1.p1 TRINITY_DN4471_c0_g1~~TRINITY_DN4471_c0_g1_i1.p1  ORF type:complete len:541 (+),score=74.63 TRINITY_DN4471_c0_g1_i1:52-1674(+)
MSEAIKVLARIRPTEGKEACRCGIDGKSIIFDEDREYPVDMAIGGSASQSDVFACIGPDAIDNVIDGYNAAVMCYGQTGSGKTYTMMGNKSKPGLAPEIMNTLLSKGGERTTFNVAAVQIYNEVCYDLFYTPKENEKKKMKEVKIREISTGVFGIPSATRRRLLPGHVTTTINDIEDKRIVAKTAMNMSSSRSHIIILVEVEQIIEHQVMYSTMYLVDLAGSEDISRSQATGLAITEAGNINRSLAALKGVIISLSDPKGKDGFINFRGSALTKLLRDCMGGNSLTCIVTNVSASAADRVETKSTLEFGQLTRRIVNHVNKNFRACYEDMLVEVDRVRDVLFGVNQDIRNLQRMLPVERKEHPSNVPLDLVCPLASLYTPQHPRPMDDPVIATDGRTYDLANLKQRFMSTASLPSAPLPMFSSGELVYFPDENMRMAVKEWKMSRLWPKDILNTILYYCNTEELLCVSLVCTWWGGKVGKDLWKRLVEKNHPSSAKKPSGTSWKSYCIKLDSRLVDYGSAVRMRSTTYGVHLIPSTVNTP